MGNVEKVAFLQRLLNGCVEILAGGEEFVIPDGDVTAEFIFVDQLHQFLGISAVFLPVT